MKKIVKMSLVAVCALFSTLKKVDTVESIMGDLVAKKDKLAKLIADKEAEGLRLNIARKENVQREYDRIKKVEEELQATKHAIKVLHADHHAKLSVKLDEVNTEHKQASRVLSNLCKLLG